MQDAGKAQKDRPQIRLLYEYDRFATPHGSGFIRLLQPLADPQIADAFRVEAAADCLDRERPDAVVIDRFWRGWADAPAVWRLVRSLRARKIPYCHALDDNLYDLEAVDDDLPGMRTAVRMLTRQAAHVVVTTDVLAQRVSTLNPRVTVIRNVINPELFQFASNGSGQEDACLTIGYMGTFTHEADLRMILWPLRTLLHRYAGRVRFELLGISANRVRMEQWFSGLPVRIVEVPDGLLYPQFIAWLSRNISWDIGIAPLCTNPFNACKSDLKYLDYTMLGVPGVYSRVPAYAESIKDGCNGLLVEDDPRAWFAALEQLLSDKALRTRLLQAARDEVLVQRTVTQAAADWKPILESLCA